MTRLVHLSDFHFDGSPELSAALHSMIDAVLEREPEVVVVTGDLTGAGRPSELDAVLRQLDRLGDVPRVVIPGNRDLEPSVGPPGDARRLPLDTDLDYFLTLEPGLSLGLDERVDGADSAPDGTNPEDGWIERFGSVEATYAAPGVQVVGVSSTPRLRSSALERAAETIRSAPVGALRVFALHHGILPVPGRKLRDGDLTNRAGDVLALLCDLEVDVVLHGHIHRAHCWQVSDGRHALVVASAGALVNDGRRDASFLELLADDGRLEVWRRSVAHGAPIMLYEGTRTVRA
jgi:3',5'-cyclic AMP phosphodiesterase CpdA